ncbi:MAG: potassium channel family protein [Nitrososphaeria archaeon]
MKGDNKYKDTKKDRLYDLVESVLFQPYAVIKHIWKQLVLLGAMISFGAAIFMNYQALDPLSAVVASISTISTIGLYAPPLNTMPSLEKILLIVIMIVSVGSAASMVQGVVTSVIKRELWTEDIDKMRIQRMSGHVIVMGYSQIGRYVAQRLIEMNYKFCVVTRVKENVKELQELNIPFILSDLKSPVEVLTMAKISDATAIVLALENDDTNMLYALTAKFMKNGIRIISINNDHKLMDGMKKAGIDVVLPIYFMVGSVAAYSVASEHVLGAIQGGDSNISGRHIVQIDVNKGSELDGASLKDIPVDVLMIIRNGELMKYNTPDTRVMHDDKLICLTDHDSIKKLNDMNERLREL